MNSIFTGILAFVTAFLGSALFLTKDFAEHESESKLIFIFVILVFCIVWRFFDLLVGD